MNKNKKVLSPKAKNEDICKQNVNLLSHENQAKDLMQNNDTEVEQVVSFAENEQLAQDNSNLSYLSVKNLSKTYIGGYSGINEITFDLNKGEKMVILGDYSSGKTTILSLLSGLESISDGKIYLNGKLINNVKIKDRNIGYLDKKLQLDRTKKVKEIISYPLKIRKVDNNIIAEKVAKVANLFEISGLLGKKIAKLTLYQQTLIALARLFICERDLYLVDDIFDNLNIAENEMLAKIICKAAAEKTIIFATSSYEIATKIAAEKLLMLAYSTMVYFGNIHAKESFSKTIAGYKLFKNKKICCVPTSINGQNLKIDGKQYVYEKEIVSDVFKKGVLLIDMDKIAFNNSKDVKINAEIYYINKDKVAYLDINSYVATIYLDGNFKVGEKINFSFNIEDSTLYDFDSERKIST